MRTPLEGRLILTMMPSLACKLSCPHCYLTQEQRRSTAILSLNSVERLARDLAALWRSVEDPQLDVYWYGGEPLQNLSPELFVEMAECLGGVGGRVRHTVLSSLVGVDLAPWAPVLRQYADSVIQTSWDGPLRGERHVQHQERNIQHAHSLGLSVDTLSVVNKGMIAQGPKAALEWLIAQRIRHAGWLPMQRNHRNRATGEYDRHAPSMNAFSDFMIEITDLARNTPGAPLIGEAHFIVSMRGHVFANRGLQTLFLLPDGDLAMPDYRADGTEFLQRFGNVADGLFPVLTGTDYASWRCKQMQCNGNPECVECDLNDCCLMEFWKPNSPHDDCMGASKYVRHVLSHSDISPSQVEHFA